jgi:hypothetical protein
MGKAEKMNCDTLFKALHMPENPTSDWCKDNPWLHTLRNTFALLIFDGLSHLYQEAESLNLGYTQLGKLHR